MDTERNGYTETEVKFLRHGYKIMDDGEVCYEWWLFDNETVIAALEPNMELALEASWDGFGTWLTGKGRYYNGPGRSFGDDPTVRVGKYHTLVTRRTGLDV